MRDVKAVKQFCRTLAGVQGTIALYAMEQDDLLLSHGYPGLYKEVEAVRGGLEDLGLYEAVKDSLTRSEALVREGKCVDAEMLVLNIGRQLMKASGAEDDLRRMYKSANDGTK